jgi:hypothetical protein
MRTTLDIHDDLMLQAKMVAAETGRTLTAVVEDALREVFARRRSPPPENAPSVLPTFGSGGLMPGVDLDNSAALLDIMEEGDAPV